MRPFVFVNLAMSADGKLSTVERRQVRISGTEDFTRVDAIKAASDAIMVGIGTVLADDPSLTVKSPVLKEERTKQGRDENPIRVVVDSNARTPPDADILGKGPGRRIVAVSRRAPGERVRALEAKAEVWVVGDETVDLSALLGRLHAIGVGRLMVEGGGTLIASLFREDLVDEFSTYIGSMIIGGSDAPTPADGPGWVHEDDFARLELIGMQQMDDGVLLRWKVVRQTRAGS
jgi:2,5-diamino-6-(ribosylamino)-4(3H)-pyrimidinone 5'-phosphate reductase